MKYLIIVLCLLSTNAMAMNNEERKELMKEYKLNQVQVQQCLLAIARSARNDNEWQEPDLTIEECRARAFESIAIGQRMMNDSIDTTQGEDND